MMAKIGLNVHHVGNWSNFTRQLALWNPDTLLFYDPALCREWQDKLPTTRIIDRAHSDNDSILHFTVAPGDYVRSLVQRSPDKRIIRYVLNEPGITPAMVAWLVNVMAEADKFGLSLVVGNFGVGRYTQEQVNQGMFDPLLKALELGRHYLGVHEYSAVIIPFGCGTIPTNDLLDRTKIQPESWARVKLQTKRLPNGGLPNHFAIGQCSWFNIRAAELDVAPPRILVTEFGLDDINGTEQVVRDLQNAYGASGYPRVRGFNSLRAVYERYYPTLTFEQVVALQLRFAKDLYPANVKSLLIYAQSDTSQWADFNTAVWNDSIWSMIDQPPGKAPTLSPLPPPAPVVPPTFPATPPPAPVSDTAKLLDMKSIGNRIRSGVQLSPAEAAFLLGRYQKLVNALKMLLQEHE